MISFKREREATRAGVVRELAPRASARRPERSADVLPCTDATPYWRATPRRIKTVEHMRDCRTYAPQGLVSQRGAKTENRTAALLGALLRGASGSRVLRRAAGSVPPPASARGPLSFSSFRCAMPRGSAIRRRLTWNRRTYPVSAGRAPVREAPAFTSRFPTRWAVLGAHTFPSPWRSWQFKARFVPSARDTK